MRIIIVIFSLILSACSSQEVAPYKIFNINDDQSKSKTIKLVNNVEKLSEILEQPQEQIAELEIAKKAPPPLPIAPALKKPTTNDLIKTLPDVIANPRIVKKPEIEKTIFKPKSKKYNIAMLLPLSGDAADVGTSLLNAAEMALFDIKNSELLITTYDTQGKEEGAISAINKAILDQADIVIGPVFKHTSKAIASIAKNNNLSVISFSNDKTLADDGIIVFGFTPENEINTILDFSLKNKLMRYSALLPDNEYGRRIEGTISKKLDKEDIFLKKTQYYNKADEKLSHSIKKLSALPKGDMQENFPNKSELLFIPESGAILPAISSRLSNKNLHSSRFRFIGVSDWAKEEIYSNKKLIGSWFASPNINDRNNFANIFEETFSYKPSNIADLAYDAIALISLAADENVTALNIKTIGGESIYEGVFGKFLFDINGVVNRELHVYEITDNGLKLID